jgi:hypothetical protein
MKPSLSHVLIITIIPQLILSCTQTSENETQENKKLNYDCNSVIGNSNKDYNWRISGELSGCHGCEDLIPRDEDLHKAILSLKKDYDGDDTLGVEDLKYAIVEAGDLNNDHKVNLYDLVYPNKIKYIKAVRNPQFINEIMDESIELCGIISEDGKKIILNNSIEIKSTNLGDSDKEFIVTKKSELFLTDYSELVLFLKSKVVLQGKISSGASKSYAGDGFLFTIDKIIGKVE